MNLLYTITTYPPSTGGGQLHQHLLAQQLSDRHKIQVVSQWDTNRTDWLLGTTLNAPGQDRDYEIDGISVHRFGLSKQDKLKMAPYVPIYYPFMRFALPKIAGYMEKFLEPYLAYTDLIHNVRIGREVLSYASFYAARKQDIPFVFTPIHHPRWIGWRYKAYIELYKQADKIIALTKTEKETLITLGVSEKQISVTGIGPVLSVESRPEKFRKQYNIDNPIVLFLGQHYLYKGFRQVLEATQLVWQKVPDVEFVFIGPPVGQSEKYFEKIDDKRIHRLGRVSLQEKTDALAAATLLCVPSSQESFGGVYTEAWSFAKPVIGCDIPAVSEVINNGVNGYLVKQDSEQIAKRILDLILNPQRAAEMGLNGQSKVKEKYTWEKISKLTEQVYEDVIGR